MSIASALSAATSFAEGVVDTALSFTQTASEFLADFPFPMPTIGLGSFSAIPTSNPFNLGPSEPEQTKLVIGGAVFQVVSRETLTETLDPQKHPVETSHQIMDHAWRDPLKISIQGWLIGYPRETEVHKRALEQLQKLKEDATPITLVTDFPPGQVKDMLLVSLKATRKMPWGNGYEVTAEFEQVHYVDQVASPAASSRSDPGLSLDGMSFASTDLPATSSQGLQTPYSLTLPSLAEMPSGDASQVDNMVVSFAGDIPSTDMALALDASFSDMQAEKSAGLAIVEQFMNGDNQAYEALREGSSVLPDGPGVIDNMWDALHQAQGLSAGPQVVDSDKAPAARSFDQQLRSEGITAESVAMDLISKTIGNAAANTAKSDAAKMLARWVR